MHQNEENYIFILKSQNSYVIHAYLLHLMNMICFKTISIMDYQYQLILISKDFDRTLEQQ